jgi:hypothetical protein
MNLRLVRRLSIWIIALFAFAQASVVFAACEMERASMAQAMTMDADEPCSCGGGEMQTTVTASCVAHCTADLQLSGLPVTLVYGLPAAPIRIAPTSNVDLALMARHAPPPFAVPRRILLHSFLI